VICVVKVVCCMSWIGHQGPPTSTVDNTATTIREHIACRFVVCPGTVVDGEDLSHYDGTDRDQEQTDNDNDTLEQLQRELTSHSLGQYI